MTLTPTITRTSGGATILAVRTSTGLIARGGPGVCTARKDAWDLIVDDHGKRTARPRRLQRILSDAASDPVRAVLRHFDAASSEVFALVGPPGVIAGGGPLTPSRAPIAVLVDHNEGVVALGFAHGIEEREDGWLALPAGIAVCWGPGGPEAFCDLSRGTSGLWEPPGTERS